MIKDPSTNQLIQLQQQKDMEEEIQLLKKKLECTIKDASEKEGAIAKLQQELHSTSKIMLNNSIKKNSSESMSPSDETQLKLNVVQIEAEKMKEIKSMLESRVSELENERKANSKSM